jgi:hypothetical protein
VGAARVMVSTGFKEPLLSPLGIKVTEEGVVKVGEWEFAHFFEDSPATEEETNFVEEGETFVEIVSHSPPDQEEPRR